jgi:hypothetical protein
MSSALGVPDSSPVLALKLAHAGRFCIEKVRGLPAGSLALGVKLYAEPALTDVAGVPVIAGGPLPESADTVMVKAGSEVLSAPLLTLIVMFA